MTLKGLVLFPVFVYMCVVQAPQTFAAVELSSDEMANVVGGVTITNFIAPADGTLVELDNPLIVADFTDEITVPDIKFEGRVNGSKIAVRTVTTTPIPGTNLSGGRFSAPAFDFPIGRTADVSITVNDGNVPNGDSINTGIRINPLIDVPVVMVHALRDDIGGPSVSNDLPLAFFDFPVPEVPLIPLTDVLGLDAILAQCTTAMRTQIRAVRGVNVINVPAGCSRPNIITQSPPPPVSTCTGAPFPVPGAPQFGTGVATFYDNLVSMLPPGFFHIFIVDDVSVNFVPIGGGTFVEPVAGPPRRWALVANQEVGFLQVFGRSMLHEFLHTRRLGHPDQPSQAQPGVIAIPSANNCIVGGGGQAGENVMCASAAVQPDPFDMVPTAGLTALQCAVAKANPNQATNFNQ